MDTKKCSHCKIEKPLDQYYQVKRKKPLVRNIKTDNRKARCKQCYAKKAKEWALNNPDKRKKIANNWVKNNEEKRKKNLQKYYQSEKGKNTQKDWRKKNRVQYLKNKRDTDLIFALKFKMRSMLNKIFYRFGYSKRSKSNEILGCDWKSFKVHIERQFKPGMTWENRKEWHIDHIIPLATAKTEQDVIKLNHYTNLRPLWAHENLAKSAKVEYLL
jgi:hypothetical protein